MIEGPYKPRQAGSTNYWTVVDTRTNQPVSYPTSQRRCIGEAYVLNRAYTLAVENSEV